MIQTTETDSGTKVTTDTTSTPARVTIEHDGQRIVIKGHDQDAVYAIRQGLSRMLDAAKGRGMPEQKP